MEHEVGERKAMLGLNPYFGCMQNRSETSGMSEGRNPRSTLISTARP